MEVVAIADLDSSRLPLGLKAAEDRQRTKPRGESDFRKLIDDKTIDALVIGTPDHPPAGVDFDMWIGAAPKRPFNVNRFHGRWRWLYDFGTGDLGNDGVHRLDMAVALLSAASVTRGEDAIGLPTTIFASGGKWYFDDAQEFPDTMQVNYEFGSGRKTKLLTYEMRVWTPYAYHGESEPKNRDICKRSRGECATRSSRIPQTVAVTRSMMIEGLHRRAYNMITIENPVEYLFTPASAKVPW